MNGRAIDGDRDRQDNPPPGSATHRSMVLVLIPFVSLLILWVVIFAASGTVQKGPRDTGLGGDFATFYTAAHMVHHGQNPYNSHSLFAAERSTFHAQRLPTPRYEPYIRAGNPPLLYWILIPLTALGFRTAALVWVGVLAILSLGGILALLRRARWTRKTVPAVMFMAMPQTVLAIYYANVDALVFAGLSLALLIVIRRPAAGGALLTVAWLKPQYAIPLAVLVFLFNTVARRRVLAGFILTTGLLVLLTMLTSGFSNLLNWTTSLRGLATHTALQPEIASLSGLYVYDASPAVSRALTIAGLVMASVITAWWFWKVRSLGAGSLERDGWLWVLWFLVSPLAHFHYQIVLAAPLLALFGRNGRNICTFPAAAALYAMLLAVVLFPPNRAHHDFQSLALLPVLAACGALARHTLRSAIPSGASTLGEVSAALPG